MATYIENIYDSNGEPTSCYYSRGVLHRDGDLPARVTRDLETMEVTKEWFSYGKPYRDGGRATKITYSSVTGRPLSEKWELPRDDPRLPMEIYYYQHNGNIKKMVFFANYAIRSGNVYSIHYFPDGLPCKKVWMPEKDVFFFEEYYKNGQLKTSSKKECEMSFFPDGKLYKLTLDPSKGHETGKYEKYIFGDDEHLTHIIMFEDGKFVDIIGEVDVLMFEICALSYKKLYLY